MNILMVGPSRKFKGGINTVINSYFNSNLTEQVNLMYLETAIDDNLLMRLLFTLRAFIKLFYKLIFNKIGIIHIHMAAKGSFFRKSLVLLMAKMFNKKIIIHLHGGKFHDFYLNSPLIIKKYISYIFNMSDHFIVLSEEWRNIILSYNVTTKISVVYNGVKVNKNTYNVNSDYLLYLGRINKDKGVYDLVQAIKELILDIPSIKLILAGIGEEEKLVSLIENYGLNKNIEFIGWIHGTEKENLISGAKAFVLPSYFEAMPMSILESMSYGIPVISTEVGGIPTLIENNREGYLFTAGDISELKNCIRKIYTNHASNLFLSKNSYKKISNKFALEKSNETILEIYYSLVKNG